MGDRNKGLMKAKVLLLYESGERLPPPPPLAAPLVPTALQGILHTKQYIYCGLHTLFTIVSLHQNTTYQKVSVELIFSVQIMLTLKELNCKDFELFRKHLNNVVFGNSMVGALWDHRPFLSIENLTLQLSEILHSLPISGK